MVPQAAWAVCGQDLGSHDEGDFWGMGPVTGALGPAGGG